MKYSRSLLTKISNVLRGFNIELIYTNMSSIDLVQSHFKVLHSSGVSLGFEKWVRNFHGIFPYP